MRATDFPIAFRRLPPSTARAVPVPPPAPRCDGGGSFCPAARPPPGTRCSACGTLNQAPQAPVPPPPPRQPPRWLWGARFLQPPVLDAYRRRWDLRPDAVVADVPTELFQQHHGLEDPIVAGMAKFVSEGGELPPVTIHFFLGGADPMTDGHHRTSLARLAGRPVRAWLVDFHNFQDAFSVWATWQDGAFEPKPPQHATKAAQQIARHYGEGSAAAKIADAYALLEGHASEVRVVDLHKALPELPRATFADTLWSLLYHRFALSAPDPAHRGGSPDVEREPSVVTSAGIPIARWDDRIVHVDGHPPRVPT